MPGKLEHAEVITPVQRRRRSWAEEKAAIIQETCALGTSVSLRGNWDCAQPATGGRWASRALSAVGAGEEVVAASEYRALRQQVREFQAAARKKTLENEILRQVLIECKKQLSRASRRAPDLQRAAVDLVIQQAESLVTASG